MRTTAESMDLHAAIGEVLRIRRQAIGMSQQELADLASVTRAQITNLELGKSGWSIQSLCDCASALEVKAWRILKDADL